MSEDSHDVQTENPQLPVDTSKNENGIIHPAAFWALEKRLELMQAFMERRLHYSEKAIAAEIEADQAAADALAAEAKQTEGEK